MRALVHILLKGKGFIPVCYKCYKLFDNDL